jgi:hypothetical protein
MTEGADIPHGKPGFEADGSPVPIVDPDIYFDDPKAETSNTPGMDVAQILDLIIEGARNRNEIAARAVLLSMLMKRPAAPQSTAEFALLMEMPRTSAQRFRARLSQCLRGALRDLWAPRRIGDE